jgi:hypothetical protein
MKKQFAKAVGVCSLLSIGLLLLALGTQGRVALADGEDAQASRKGKQEKTISVADRQAIEALFKDADSSKYRLQFNDGTRTLGNLKVGMQDLEQVRKYRNPAEAAGYIVFVVEGKDVIYALAIGHEKVQSLLGKEKAEKLNQIMAKYAR